MIKQFADGFIEGMIKAFPYSLAFWCGFYLGILCML
jgi:hypothetical protein